MVPLEVPALRNRRGDIPALVQHFMTRAAEGAGLPRRRMSEDAIATLQAYAWPGNVRQLRNVIDWILIMVPGGYQDLVRADMLPPDIGSIAPSGLIGESGTEVMALPLREARGVCERQYLAAQVLRFRCNISRPAGLLGMEPSALHRTLRPLCITASRRPSRPGVNP